MITSNVTITKIDKPEADSKYPRLTIHYKDDDGQERKKGNLVKNLDNATLDELRVATKEIENGGAAKRVIDVEKQGDFWNLVAVGKEGSKPATTAKKKDFKGGGGYKQATPEEKKRTDTKIQVMNALTNAIVSLGAGKTTKEYKERVLEFVTLGNEVVDTVLSNNLPIPEPLPALEDDEVTQEFGF